MKDRLIWGLLFCTGLAAGAAGIYTLSQPTAPEPAAERPTAAATIAPIVETDTPIVVAVNDPSADRKREVQAMWAMTTAENLRDPMDLTKLVELELKQKPKPQVEDPYKFPEEGRGVPKALGTSTLGVIHDRADAGKSVVLFEGNVLQVGSVVPVFPAITVESVDHGVVTYQYNGDSYSQPVEGR